MDRRYAKDCCNTNLTRLPVDPHGRPGNATLSRSNDFSLPRYIRGLGTVLRVQFAQDVGDVVLDGTLGQHKTVGNVAIAGSGGQQLEDSDFAAAQFLVGATCPLY